MKDAINISTGAVTTPNAIPQGAKAVSFTLTVTDTAEPRLRGRPARHDHDRDRLDDQLVGPVATLATGGIVSLGTGPAERQVTLVVGGGGTASTDVIVDITGYFK